MISLVPLGLDPNVAQSTSTTTSQVKPPVMKRITVQALSTWNALIIGIVTGFAMSAGTLLFTKLARKAGWQSKSER